MQRDRVPSFLSGLEEGVGTVRRYYLIDSFIEGLKTYFSDRINLFFAICLVVLLFMAAFGPMIAPSSISKYHMDGQGNIDRLASPSVDHPLGTNDMGQDVFSRLLFGSRATVLIGFISGIILVSIGLSVGILSGYFGGWVDGLLMRFTDFAYGVPLIPTAIVLVAYMGLNFWSTIALLGVFLWRGNARVFRSQVLQIKEREHVKVAEAFGASDSYIITKHILPNMVGMVMLFFALGSGVAILLSASLAFLGFMNPFVPSWGIMLRNAYQSGFAMEAWWWTFSAGLAISFTVLVIIMLGRGYERITQTNVDEVQA